MIFLSFGEKNPACPSLSGKKSFQPLRVFFAPFLKNLRRDFGRESELWKR